MRTEGGGWGDSHQLEPAGLLRGCMTPEHLSQGPGRKENGLCDYEPDICHKILVPKAVQKHRAKLEAHTGHRSCRKKAVKPEARPSQDP